MHDLSINVCERIANRVSDPHKLINRYASDSQIDPSYLNIFDAVRGYLIKGVPPAQIISMGY